LKTIRIAAAAEVHFGAGGFLQAAVAIGRSPRRLHFSANENIHAI
jgi:hypothetical protein